MAATFHVSEVSHFMSHALLEGLPRKGQLIKYYVWVSIWNTHVLNYKGHQLSVHNFFVQLYPSIYSCPLCTTAYFTLWRRCFPLGFHQSPRSSHSCLLVLSHSGVGAFFRDFTRALFLYLLSFWPRPTGCYGWFGLNFVAFLHVFA